MRVNIKNNAYWIGKIDWELRKFHVTAGFEVINDGPKITWNPNDEQTSQCIDYGRDIAKEGI